MSTSPPQPDHRDTGIGSSYPNHYPRPGDNLREDDCDGLMDAADPDCAGNPNWIFLAAAAEPWLELARGECGGATLAGPYDVIRGDPAHLRFASGSVDLGPVDCVAGRSIGTV
jgi:hypothetical protein